MKVYVITNYALHHDSTYYDVIAVTKSKEDAYAVLATEKHDFLEIIENGGMQPDFNDFTNLNIIEEECVLKIEDNITNMFEEWTITECNLNI